MSDSKQAFLDVCKKAWEESDKWMACIFTVKDNTVTFHPMVTNQYPYTDLLRTNSLFAGRLVEKDEEKGVQEPRKLPTADLKQLFGKHYDPKDVPEYKRPMIVSMPDRKEEQNDQPIEEPEGLGVVQESETDGSDCNEMEHPTGEDWEEDQEKEEGVVGTPSSLGTDRVQS